MRRKGNVMIMGGSRDVAVLTQSMLEAKDVGERRSLPFKFSESRNCNISESVFIFNQNQNNSR